MSKDEHRSTLRVLSILLELSQIDNGLSLAELSARLDTPKSSLFPIVHTMANMNFITFDKNTKLYNIGLNSFLVGQSYLQKNSTLDCFQTELEHIVTKCSEICQLGILETSQVLYLLKVDSPEPIHLCSNIGKKLPAYCTSLGKALLCNYTLDELHSLYPEPFTQFTQNTVKNIESLFEQLKIIKETNISIDYGEVHPDIYCIAVPIFKGNDIIASISVSIPSYRFSDEKKEEITNVLLSSKAKLESLMLHNGTIPFK